MKTRIHELIAKKQTEEAALGKGRFLNASIIAKESGLSRHTIKAWLDGDLERFENRTVVALCRYFNCQMEDLLYVDWEAEDQKAS